jgi:hypothetical protein
MPQLGFEPMIPVFEQAKMVHALDRVATVIGQSYIYIYLKKTEECDNDNERKRGEKKISYVEHISQ